jgi:hypothetical protein
VGQITDAVVDLVVGIKKCLYMPPGALDRVHMSTSTLVNETDRVIDFLVYVTVRFYVPVCRSAVTDDRSAGFDPVRNMWFSSNSLLVRSYD